MSIVKKFTLLHFPALVKLLDEVLEADADQFPNADDAIKLELTPEMVTEVEKSVAQGLDLPVLLPILEGYIEERVVKEEDIWAKPIHEWLGYHPVEEEAGTV